MESRFSRLDQHIDELGVKQVQIVTVTDAASNIPADYDPLSNTDVTIHP